MQWILASRSPRRRELLKELIPEFEVVPATGAEEAEAATPSELVRTLARHKAEEVAARKESAGKGVLGADTVVSLDGKILGKPKDEAEAFSMLSSLSGRKHEVYTGVCLIYPTADGRKTVTSSARTEVEFNELSEAFIRSYIAGGSPMDKAGGYGIQDGGLVKGISGSYSNVVGLPLELLKELFSELTAK